MEVETSGPASRRTLHSGDRIVGWLLGRLSPAPSHVPRNWELVHLASVARLESGHTPSRRHPEYWNGDIPWISLHDSAALDVPEIHSTALTISSLGLENSSARLLPKGTVVFSRTATVGKSTAMGRPMATSQDFANYVCGSRLHNNYLVHLFRFMAPEWKRLMAGSTHNSIYMPVFQDLQILLPPYAEQEAIAEALSDADTLIESLEQLVAKKSQLKQGAMQELLTGKTRLPGFLGDWDLKRFGEITQPRKERIDPRRAGPHEFCIELEHMEQGTGCLTGYTATAEGSSLKSVFQKNDVLFGKLRAYLRKYWIADREGVCSTEIWALAAKSSLLIPQFLFQIVKVDRFVEAASLAYGTHMPRSDWNVVKNYVVELPPIPEQIAITEILTDMDAEITALETKLVKARQIKQGMMQELLTGRIHLV